MPEKLSHEADPKHVPDVVYVSPMELKPKRVGIGLVVGAIVLAIGIGGAYFITNFVLTDATPAPSVETKKTSPSATTATPLAQKAETAGWKTYTNKELGFSIMHPADWLFRYITEMYEGNSVKVLVIESPDFQLNDESNFVGDVGARAGVTLDGEKDKNIKLLSYANQHDSCCDFKEINLGKNEVVKGEATNEDSFFVDYYISDGSKVVFISVRTNVQQKFQLIPVVDKIISTFKFLD